MITFISSMIHRKNKYRSVRTGKEIGLLLVVLAVGVTGIGSAALATKANRPFIFADIDGDGKRDGFYRVRLSNKKVEIGVRLTRYGNKYVKIYEALAVDEKEESYAVYKRKDLIEDLRCKDDNDCSRSRVEGLSVLRNCDSPEVVDIGSEGSGGRALCMNRRKKIVEAWYSD